MNIFGKPKLKTLPPAEAALGKYQQTAGAIAKAVADLQPLITARQAAERSLRDAEIGASDGDTGNLQPARKRLDGTLRALDEAAARLRGLRGRALAFGSELAAQYEVLADELPTYHTALTQDFASEWAAACEAFSKALGKKAALEALTGEPLALSQPTPSPCDLGEMGKPKGVLAAIKAGIQSIVTLGTERHAVAALPGVPVIAFDPTRVYTLRRAADNLPENTLVVEASFAPGELARLVGSRWAVEAQDQQATDGAWAARLAAKKIEAAAAAEEDRKRKETEAEMRRQLNADAERRDPRLRNWQPEEQPVVSRVEIKPTTMYPDNPEKRGAVVRAAHMHPPGPAQELARDKKAIETLIGG